MKEQVKETTVLHHLDISEDGKTAFHHICKSGDIELITLMLKNGGWASNQRDYYGNTPVHYAAIHKNKELMEIFKESSGMFIKNDHGQTPSDVLSSGLKEELLPEIDQNKLKIPAIHGASYNGNLHKLKFLVKEKTDVNLRSENKSTPLHYALISNNLDVVKFLLEHKANIEAKDKNGNRPLHIACIDPNYAIIEFFLNQEQEQEKKKKVDVDAENVLGITPLYYLRYAECSGPGREKYDHFSYMFDAMTLPEDTQPLGENNSSQHDNIIDQHDVIN